jgi:hypothetical protein
VTKIRESARGENCLVRIPGVCNWDSATVVLAHLGGGGYGMKSPDYLGAYCCSACHDALDGRVPSEYSRQRLTAYHWHGIGRTLKILVEKGLLIEA